MDIHPMTNLPCRGAACRILFARIHQSRQGRNIFPGVISFSLTTASLAPVDSACQIEDLQRTMPALD